MNKLKLICYFHIDLTENLKKWWIWGYWMSPLMYAQNAISVNEFLGASWSKVKVFFPLLSTKKYNLHKFF
jgi:hypothetical protein